MVAGMGLMKPLLRLPQLDAISLGIDEPAEVAEVVAVALSVYFDTSGDEAVEQSIQVVDLKIQHGRLGYRVVVRFCREKRYDCTGALLRGVEGKAAVAPFKPEVLFIPRIQRFRIFCPQKRSAYSGCLCHASLS